MNSDDFDNMVVAVLVVIVLALALFAFGVEIGSRYIRSEAVSYGAAHYSCDPQTGQTTFNWNRPQKEIKK